MLLAQVLGGLLSDLEDDEPGYEGTRTSLDDLERWWQEGRCLVGSLRPDMFARPVAVELKPGSIQDLSECCNQIGAVLGQSDSCGNLLRSASPENFALASAWTGKACLLSNPSEYRLLSYASDPLGGSQIIVRPPVPRGVKAYLLVNCSALPDAPARDDEVSDLDCGSLAAVNQWVLFRAWSRDNEDTPTFRKAIMAARMFYQILNLKFRAELLYELGALPVNKGTQLLNLSTGSAQ